MNKKIPSVLAIGIILILSVIIGGVFFLGSQTKVSDDVQIIKNLPKSQKKQTACTEEAKVCPDGSAVSRAEPDCDFPACPKITSFSPGGETCSAFESILKKYGKVQINSVDNDFDISAYRKNYQGKFCSIKVEKTAELATTAEWQYEIVAAIEKRGWISNLGADGASHSVYGYIKGNSLLVFDALTESDGFEGCKDYLSDPFALQKCIDKSIGKRSFTIYGGKFY